MEARPLTIFDAAYLGSRFTAVLLAAPLLESLPQIPLDLELLRLKSSTGEGNAFVDLLSGQRVGGYMNMVYVLLLAVTCVFLWTRAEKVAQSVTSGMRPGVGWQRSIVTGFVAVAGWIMVLASLHGLGRSTSQLLTAPEMIISKLEVFAPFVVLAIGITLILGRDGISRIAAESRASRN